MLRRRYPVVLAVAAVAGGLSLGSALLQRPRFVATASVRITQPAANVLDPAAAAPGSANAPARRAGDVVTSPAVRGAVAAVLGSAPPVTVTTDRSGQVIEIHAAGPEAARAALVATTYATAFGAYLTNQARAATVSAEAQLRAQLSTAGSEIAQLPPGGAAQRTELTDEEAVFHQELDHLQQQAVAAADLGSVAPAQTPPVPVAPRPVRRAVLGLLAGLAAGILAGALLSVDGRIGTLDQATALAGERPVWVGLDDLVGLLSGPEARRWRTLLVTGPSPAAGTTSVVADLGITLAGTGGRLILGDCCFGRPRLHQRFRLANDAGLTSVLSGEIPLFEALQTIPGPGQRWLLAAGPAVPRLGELLASGRAADVLAALSAHADLVLLDGSPVPDHTGAVLDPRLVDGVVVVIRAGGTRRRAMGRVLEQLAAGGANVVGIVALGIGRPPLEPAGPVPAAPPPVAAVAPAKTRTALSHPLDSLPASQLNGRAAADRGCPLGER